MNNPFLSRFYCKHLQEYGRCQFNRNCIFNHNAPPRSYSIPDNVCVYHLKNKCIKQNCNFLHISPTELLEQLRVLTGLEERLTDLNINEPTTSSSKYSNNRSPYKTGPRFSPSEFKAATKLSEEKVCGICMEDVKGDKRFGLLEKCNHVYCYECIMTWRKTKNSTIGEDTTKSCPECRVTSLYVIPSRYYAIDDVKKRIIEQYKTNRKDTLCKFEKNGVNNCRFKDSCFFKHNLPFKTRPPIRPSEFNLDLNDLNLTDFNNFSIRIPNSSVILNTSFHSDDSDSDLFIAFAF